MGDSKNREQFDLILTGQLCTNQFNKVQDTKANFKTIKLEWQYVLSFLIHFTDIA